MALFLLYDKLHCPLGLYCGNSIIKISKLNDIFSVAFMATVNALSNFV